MLFIAEQDAARLMIFEQRCALLIDFRIKFNLIFVGAPSIRSLVAVLSMLLFNTQTLMGIHYAQTADINEVVEEFIRVHPRRLFDHSLFELIC